MNTEYQKQAEIRDTIDEIEDRVMELVATGQVEWIRHWTNRLKTLRRQFKALSRYSTETEDEWFGENFMFYMTDRAALKKNLPTTFHFMDRLFRGKYVPATPAAP